MKYQQLLSYSKANIGTDFPDSNEIISFQMFKIGCGWMFIKLNKDIAQPNALFNSSINYLGYGLLKYTISLLALLFSAWLFLKVNVFLVPLSIVLFYLAEVHFLFLFPIVLDNVKNPVWTSLKQTYKVGVINALITVVPIGCFMVWGLINFRNPFRNWYIGCLAIIIWYKDEIRNRL